MSSEKKLRFDLTPSGDDCDYTLTQTDGDPVLGPDNLISLGEKHWYWLYFTLTDATRSFDGPVQSIFRVRPGNSCPGRQNASVNRNFPKNDFKFEDNGRTLRVKAKNIEAGPFGYRIVIKSPEGECDFDPVIINGGGGEGFIGALSAPLILVGIVLLVVIAYATGLFERLYG